MIHVRAHVRNGRLVVDEPTDLPEGTEVDLVEEEVPREVVIARIRAAPPADRQLTPDEIIELEAIHARGKYVTTAELRAKLRDRG